MEKSKSVERQTFRIAELGMLEQKYHGPAYNNFLYVECMEIRKKFLDTGVYEADHWTWRLINDFLWCTYRGWVVKNQIRKVKEAVLKYGKDSTFWEERNRTNSIRNAQTLRISNDVHVIVGLLDRGGLTKILRQEFNLFKKVSLDLRKKLMMKPLSEKQFKILYKVERLAGIYYEDLSEEEQGIILPIIERK